MANHTEHSYAVQVRWTGNLGDGTSGYKAYERAHEISGHSKPVVLGSSDPALRGDPSRYNPEELLVAALSACHMLWYLHLCTDAKIIVTDYMDHASGTMVLTADGSGHFTAVVLKPSVTIQRGGDVTLAERLHARAHQLCFIANSVNFPVRCEPTIHVQEAVSA